MTSVAVENRRPTLDPMSPANTLRYQVHWTNGVTSLPAKPVTDARSIAGAADARFNLSRYAQQPRAALEEYFKILRNGNVFSQYSFSELSQLGAFFRSYGLTDSARTIEEWKRCEIKSAGPGMSTTLAFRCAELNRETYIDLIIPDETHLEGAMALVQQVDRDWAKRAEIRITSTSGQFSNGDRFDYGRRVMIYYKP